MAVEWLDGGRYADSSGYQTDAERSMWRWRDWVIDAYNDNMPFDQFTIEQIAGDLLPDATLDQRIATAFNRNHSQNGEGGIVPEEFLVENVVDRVATTSTVWLGLTLGCARCHDHKFDPISQKEFYEVFAYFNNVPERGKAFKYGNSPPLVTAPTADQYAELAELDVKLSEAREVFSGFETEAAGAQQQWEDSLSAAGRVDWVLRDQLLVHHPLDGDIAGVYTGAPVTVSPAVTAGLRANATSPEVTLPVKVTLEDGQPRFVPGRVGAALSFDGQRFINAGDIANFSYDDPFTLAAWIYSTAPDGVILSRALAGDQGEQGWGLYLVDGKLQVNLSQRYMDDGVRVETRDVLPLNEWQHVLVTYDGKRVPAGFRVYVNGQSQEITPRSTGSNNPMRTREPLRIGASGSARENSGATDSRPRFQGQIDNVRIYTAVLTPGQAAVVATAESLSEIARIAPASRTAGQSEKLWGSWFLPSEYQGVKFLSTGDPVLYLSNPPGVDRSARRRFLDDLGTLNRQDLEEFGDPETSTCIAQYEMAYRMQASVPELTDLSDEPDSVFERYGEDSRTPGTFAANCLLARQLAERDVRFIELFHRGWDMHTQLPRRIQVQAKDVDQPQAALIQELKERGLLDETLVVWGGEFGRTIFCQGRLTDETYGRDHHSRCFTIWMAGGGIKPGTTYGESDDFAFNIVKDPVHIHDLHATMLHLLGIDHTKLTFPYQGRNFRLTDVHGEVVQGVLA